MASTPLTDSTEGYYLMQSISSGDYNGGTSELLGGSDPPEMNWLKTYDSTTETYDDTGERTAALNLSSQEGLVYVFSSVNDEGQAYYGYGGGGDVAGYSLTYDTDNTEFTVEYSEAELNGLKKRYGGDQHEDFFTWSYDGSSGEYSNFAGRLAEGLDSFMQDILATLYVNTYSFKQVKQPPFQNDMVDVFEVEEEIQTLTFDSSISQMVGSY
tara:strand:+ start:2123 stop:2758 length:636 start_codon:yes stop_codon:yes gene_type:complete